MPVRLFCKSVLVTALILTCLTLTGSARGATYWVSPDGQAAWAACLGETPLSGIASCNISTANRNAVAGDTVYLRAGRYTENYFINPSNSGTPGSPITFEAYNNEVVVVTTQRVANGDHESGAWAAHNGASVERSSVKAWDGSYSTRFTATSAGQGIRSSAFDINRDGGMGLYYTIRVHSSANSVNLQLRGVDNSSVPLNTDLTLVPNIWNTLEGWVLPTANGQYLLQVTSPSGVAAGTWYVDGVLLNPYQPSIYLNGRDHIVVRGITFSGISQGLDIRNGSDYNEIDHCVFTAINTYSANLIWDQGGTPSRYNWIHDSVFHDIGYVKRGASATDCDDISTPLRIGNDTGRDASSYNLIENNQFYHGGHDLMIIATKYNTIRGNVLRNEGWLLNREGPCSSAAGGYNNPAYFGDRGILIENPGGNGGYNLLEGNRIGFAGTPPDDDGANGIENPADGNIVRYNLIYKAQASGFYFKGQPGTASDVVPDYNYLYNNTIYKNGGGADINAGFQGGLALRCYVADAGYPSKGNVLKNNIVFDNTVAVLDSQCIGNGFTYTSNMETNPLFVNPDVSDPTSLILPNLALQAASPAIDGASELTTVRVGDPGSGTTLSVIDARYFQSGTWGPPGRVRPDTIAVGTTTNTAQIVTIDYVNNVVVLSASLPRRVGDKVWLARKSDGAQVLAGAGPDFGASEYGTGAPSPPGIPRVIR